jgi:hypothetical protein
MEEQNGVMERKDHEDSGEEEVGEESYDFRMSYLWALMKMNG